MKKKLKPNWLMLQKNVTSRWNFNYEKVRGTSVAVPSLRSSENLGIGNYSDLASLLQLWLIMGWAS